MSKKVKTPIMSSDNERFMAFEGLVQWTSGVIAQAERVAYSKKLIADMSPERRRAAIHAGHCEAHYFVTAVAGSIGRPFQRRQFDYCHSFSKNQYRSRPGSCDCPPLLP
jgi:hypothetical protein